jgi:hypothetical protein
VQKFLARAEISMVCISSIFDASGKCLLHMRPRRE